MEAKKDCLVRAISKDGFVNAVAVYTRGLTERARQIHHTSPVATAALGRALAACSMMGNALKDNGASVTMQIKGDGPLGTILTVSDSEGNVRGYVQNPAVDLALREDGKLDVGTAAGTRGHVRSTPWAMRVSILLGHGSNSCVRFMGYSLRPFGSAFGSGKSSGRKQQLMQTKRPETLRFRVFLARREGFEPPAFWSVGCLKGKSELFRLRFVLFTAVRSADFPLFPSSPARSNSILGQKWVRENFEITKQKLSSVCPI